MASDQLLTTLCSICRIQPPRYKCPGCSARYCSVPCNRRHRARTGCSGIRDVTAFVPRAKLCTEAGIDHDYNFLKRIEVARFSTAKHVVDEGRVLREGDIKVRVVGEDDGDGETWSRRGPRGAAQKRGRFSRHQGHNRQDANQPALLKQWHGEELLHVPARPRGAAAAAVALLANESESAMSSADPIPSASPVHYESAASHRVRALCRRSGITLIGAPRGLARQRANNTTVATERMTAGRQGGSARTAGEVRLHWQVEWLVYGEDSLDPVEVQSQAAKPTRVLRRLLDNVPLFQAYVSLMASGRRLGQGNGLDDATDVQIHTQRPNKLLLGKPEHPVSPLVGSPDSNSFFYAYDTQDEITGAWQSPGLDKSASDGVNDSLHDEHLAAKYELRYFLLRPRAPGSTALQPGQQRPKNELIPLAATDTLATALPGRSVLEFPTIYVLPAVSGDDDRQLQSLPPGCILGSTVRQPVYRKPRSQHGIARKRPWSEHEAEDGKDDGDAGDGADCPLSVKKRRARASGDHGPEDAGDAEKTAEMESETSSSGEDSSDAEEDDDDSETEEQRSITGLPPLLGSDARKLVVYDSWSEGSDEE